MATPFLSLIVPAYNEGSRLPTALQQIDDYVKSQTFSSEVLVIENGSLDNTFSIAADFAKTHKRFSVRRTSERGKGLAVRQGMLAAAGEFRMMLDADLSMPVDQINRFLPPVQKDKDIVIASREAPGAVRYNEPGYRHMGGRVINTMIRVMALPGLQDTQCGFKCFRAEVAEDLFSQQTIMGWAFDVEILYIARLRGYSIEELPIPWYFSEQSHLRPVYDAFHIFFDLLRIRANAARGLYGHKA
ncbi:MAG: glycosyltransferase [Chloroflexi bacterium]|nr:glycosyltransferase [Chloroflexota bacterium]